MHDIAASVAAIPTIRRSPHGIKLLEDAARYEKVIAELQPRTIIETGTAFGNSAAWFAQRCERVITIDIAHHLHAELPKNVMVIQGSSVDSELVLDVLELIKEPCLISLDSDHHCEHVREELEWWPTHADYLVVEDVYLEKLPGGAPDGEDYRSDGGPGLAFDLWFRAGGADSFQIDFATLNLSPLSTNVWLRRR